ncbi:MAG: hypothetical protein KFB93_03330 [Simkaniaceae bacterium]|nr:MAG: hypothetical protein KFB93_03330 [Simkaniaceae bacterium]
MSDVSNVSETPSMIEAASSENFFYEPLQTLCEQASEAIENKETDRAIEILVALDKGQYKGGFIGFQKSELVKALFKIVITLWSQDPVAGQKLLNLDFQTFIISLEGNRVDLRSTDECYFTTFTFEHKTSAEGKELLKQAFDLFEEKEFTPFEEALKELLQMHVDHQISDKDIVYFAESLCRENIVAAERFFPLMNAFLKIAFEDNHLVIQANTFTGTSPEHFYAFRDVELGLKKIAEEDDTEERMNLYIKLAGMHEDRATEILKMAEAELSKLSSFEQVEGTMSLSSGYAKCKNVEALKALTPKLEEAINLSIETVKVMQRITLSLHQATIALTEKDKQTFDSHVSSIKHSLSNLAIDDEDIEEQIAELEEKGEKTFPTDPMILKNQKV